MFLRARCRGTHEHRSCHSCCSSASGLRFTTCVATRLRLSIARNGWTPLAHLIVADVECAQGIQPRKRAQPFELVKCQVQGAEISAATQNVDIGERLRSLTFQCKARPGGPACGAHTLFDKFKSMASGRSELPLDDWHDSLSSCRVQPGAGGTFRHQPTKATEAGAEPAQKAHSWTTRLLLNARASVFRSSWSPSVV